MKIAINIIAGLVAISGFIWFFQGIGVIGGSFMTGQSTWTVIGLIAFVIAGVVLYNNNRKQAKS